jgi:hypothetical protein
VIVVEVIVLVQVNGCLTRLGVGVAVWCVVVGGGLRECRK